VWVDKGGQMSGNSMDKGSIILEISEQAKAMEAQFSQVNKAEEIEFEIMSLIS